MSNQAYGQVQLKTQFSANIPSFQS